MHEAGQASDDALIRAFADTRSEGAFRALVQRHAGWVYAAAFRQLRDGHLAEDATQAVFALLAQRAKQMKREQKLSGWLFATMGYTVRSMIRSRRRRERHERLAALERVARTEQAPPLADDLDLAVGRLSEKDRTAVLLRFYRGLEFEGMARELGITEEAARKRVARAIGRLRGRLGGAVSAGSLTAAAAFGGPVNPAALGTQVGSVALSAACGGPVPAGMGLAVKGATFLMAMINLKFAAIIVVVLALLGTGVWVATWEVVSDSGRQMTTSALSSSPVSLAATGQQTFEAVYGLRPGEVIRVVPPPFVKARTDYYRRRSPAQARAVPEGPDAMMVIWRNGKPRLGMIFGSRYSVGDLISQFLHFSSQDVEGNPKLAQILVKGDLVVDGNASTEQLRTAMEKIFTETIGAPVTLSYQNVWRRVIVFKGTWQPKHVDGTPWRAGQGAQIIELYGEKVDADPGRSGGTRISGLGEFVGDWIHQTVFIEAAGVPAELQYQENYGWDDKNAGKHANDLELVCNHVQEQTGLTWSWETRLVKRLFVERGK